MFFFHNTLNILYYHYGVIHNKTDSQNKPQQGQHIEGEAEYKHESERSNQRNRNGDKRYYGGAPALKEQENDNYYKKKSLEQRLVHFIDRL